MSNIYKIGDISKILNTSSEMIRYYEKCGFIKPDRNNNKYRKYTLHDIFALTECLYYKSWKIKIADIKDSIYATSNEDALKNMCLYRNHLEKSIEYLQLKCNRVNQIINYQKTFKQNEGNYWVKAIPEKKVFEFARGTQQQFSQHELHINDEFGKNGFFNEDLIFFDIEFELDDTMVKWNYTIESQYFDSLKSFKSLPAKKQEEKLCLCTVLKIESLQDINNTLFNSVLDYAKEKNYSIIGPISIILIGRTYENDKFSRYVEVQLPIDCNN